MITEEYVNKMEELIVLAEPVFKANPNMTNNDAFRLWGPPRYSRSVVRRVMAALRRGGGIDPTKIRYRLPDPATNPAPPEDIAPIETEVVVKTDLYNLSQEHVVKTAEYIREQYQRMYNCRKADTENRGMTAERYVNSLDMSERKRTRLLSVGSSYAQANGWVPVYVASNVRRKHG